MFQRIISTICIMLILIAPAVSSYAMQENYDIPQDEQIITNEIKQVIFYFLKN